MTDADLKEAFKAYANEKVFSRRIAITLADMADMPVKSFVLRCERLGLVKDGSWDWFVSNGGITPDQIKQIRAERAAT